MAIGPLIKLGGNLEQPRDSKPSDYPAVGTGSVVEASGSGKLIKQTETQEGTQHTQDSGSGTPSVWGKADFPVGKSTSEGGTSVSIKGGIDLVTGQMTPNAVDQTY